MKEVEDQISQRKAEVEKLIKEMREANLESLAISPPEESKQFLDGNFFDASGLLRHQSRNLSRLYFFSLDGGTQYDQRWLDYLSITWPFITMKMYPIAQKYAILFANFAQC